MSMQFTMRSSGPPPGNYTGTFVGVEPFDGQQQQQQQPGQPTVLLQKIIELKPVC